MAKNIKILFVSDKEENDSINQPLFAEQGYQIISTDYQNADKMVNTDFQLLILSLTPENYPQVFKKAVQLGNSIPLLFLSSSSDIEIMNFAEDVTHHGFVTKEGGDIALLSAVKTAFKLLKAEQESSKTQLRENAIINALPDLIFVIDKKGEYQQVYTSDESLLFFNPQTLIGKNVAEIFSKKETENCLSCIKESLSREEVQTFEYSLLLADGIHSFEARITKIDDDQALAVCRDVTRKKKIEEELNLKSMIMDQISDRVTITDLEGKIIYINQAEVRMTGYQQKDLIGKKTDVYGEDEQRGATQKEILDTTIRDGFWQGVVINYGKDGEELKLDCRTQLIYNSENSPVALCGIARDVTEQQESEKRLRENESKYRNIINHASQMLFLHNLDGRIVDVNYQAVKNTGYSREELLRMNVFDIDPDAKLNKHDQLYWHGLKLFQAHTAESRHRKKDGTFYPAEISLKKIVYDETVYVLALAQDITERRQIAKKLQDSEKKYRELFENVPVGIYRTTPEGKILMANSTLIKMLGYDSFNDLATRNLASDVYEPGYSRNEFLNRMEKNGNIKGLDSTWTTKNGQTIHLIENARPVRDANGKTLYYEGTVEDITERKKAEIARREREERVNQQRKTICNILRESAVATARMPEALRNVTEAVSEIIGVERVSIWLISEDKSELRCLSLFVKQEKRHCAGEVLKVADFPKYFKALRIDGQIDADDVQNDLRCSELANNYFSPLGITSLLDDAIRFEGKLIGVVSLEHVGRIRQWYTDEKAFLTTISAIVAQVLTNAERRKAEKELLDSKNLLQGIFESIQDGMSVLNCNLELVHVNTTMEKWYKENLPLRGKKCYEAYHNKNQPCKPCPSLRCLETGNVERDIFPGLPGSEVEWVEVFSYPMIDQSTGEKTGVVEFVRDITESIKKDHALKESEQYLKTTLQSIGDGVITTDNSGMIVNMNPIAENMCGWKLRDASGKLLTEVFKIVDSKTEEDAEDPVKKVIEYGMIVGLANHTVLIAKDGTSYHISDSAAPIKNAHGELIGVVLVFSDITEKYLAEQRIRESERKYSVLLSNLPGIAYRSKNDRDWTMEYVSEGCVELTGYEREDFVGNKAISFNELINPECREELWNKWQQCLRDRVRFSSEYQIITKEGKQKWVWEQGEGIYSENGDVIAMEGFITDVTDDKHREELLEGSRRHLRNLVDNTPTIIFSYTIQDKSINITYVNDNVKDVLGYTPEEFKGDDRIWRDSIHPDDLDSVLTDLRNFNINGKIAFQRYRFADINGKYHWMEDRRQSLVKKGGSKEIFGIWLDVSDLVIAEQEKESIQNQFVQLQKMDSIGRLAGGIAHDFNNTLSVILGYTEKSLQSIDSESKLYKNMMEIKHATERSSQLTQQLLGYARKQTITPKTIDLNIAINNLINMLNQLVGDIITLTFKAEKSLWTVTIDPVQIDQILVNLCVNARDAITGSGAIVIETQNVTDESQMAIESGAHIVPDEYIMLKIVDDGCGMDEQTLVNVFDPFFTTKKIGEGVGLGLPTVLGIVKQNNGYMITDSEPGKGTAFYIYLPRSTKEVDQIDDVEISVPKTADGKKTLLIVEDDGDILELLESMVTGLGHEVITANKPSVAIEKYQTHSESISLVLTDVMMPEMNGVELIKELQKINPGLKALFMSGYSAEIIPQDKRDNLNLFFISKPFSRIKLENKLSDIFNNTKSHVT